ncbi:hypothetical protein O181_109642 [Austropuccinia psidii MF-1]|uniref:Uncharacterized protein n=1 Tax=Austropuccinia psidii MF-1 TaxID=1389203 RepID=A0A9Q3JY94_9BASI|nr:hypothetical protein [Austropuccinia psidii MF-1]
MCDRCQEGSRNTGKTFGHMIPIQEPKSHWEVANKDWVTALSPSGENSYNASLVIVDRYRKTPILLPCHKDDTSIDTASHKGIFKNIIIDRVPELTFALWTNLHRFLGLNYHFLQNTTLKLMGWQKEEFKLQKI